MKKTVGVLSLIVMLLSQVFTPFTYAVSGEEVLMPEPVVEEQDVDPVEEVASELAEEVQQPETEVVEEPSVQEPGDTVDEGIEGENNMVLEPGVQPGIELGISSGDIEQLTGGEKNLEEENSDEIGTGKETSFIETIKDFFGIGDNKAEEEKFESKEIYGTGEYEGVQVEVYAQTGLFASGTELTIEPVIEDKLETVHEVLLSGEVDLVEEQVIAFDITFRDPLTQEELQPKDGTVQVKFNYEENESLVQAEENEEQEVKIYHLNDIDEEGNKIEELTGTIVEEVVVNEEESGEDNVMVVDAESFSVYTIVVQVRQEQLMNFEYGMISIANPSNSSQGITIMDRNLGATVAGGGIDAPVESYGYYYQWGNNYGFSSNSDAVLKTKYSSVNVSSLDEYYSDVFITNSSWMSPWKNLWTAGSQGPCPEGWHIPTTSERDTLKSYYNSSYGTSFEGFVNYFNIPFAGYRNSNSTIYDTNYRIAMWTSSTTNNSYYHSYIVGGYTYNTSTSSFYGGLRSEGNAATVRCFKNSYEGLNNNLHTITFDYRGGKGSTTSINVKHGSKGQVPSIPIRLLSSFLGWYLLGTNTEFDFTGTTITEDISLYAKWSCNNGFIENESGTGCSGTYNFDANGGFFSGNESNTVQTLQYSCDESDCYTNDILKNPQKVSLDMSQQSGWMFAGWYMKSGINGDWGEEFNPKTATTTTAYAKWLPFNDISIKDGDQVGFTIMDRNLGAESTSYGSSLDGIGYYYQWGNNYGFSNNSSVIIRTSSDKVDTSGYGPDNYYSSNIFIKSLPWDLSNNKNLWGGTGDSLKTRGEGTDKDRQGPCPVGYHVPSTLEWNFAYNVWNSSEEKSTDEDSDYKNFVKDFKLPFAGYRSYYDVTVSSQGTYGYYLSSSPVSNSTSVYALYMKNDGTFNTQYSVATSYGYSLRCFKNLPKTKKIQYFTETGEKITESILDWWDSIPYIDNHVERTGYEYLGWFESGSNEGFDFSEDIARSVSLFERWVDIDGITEANTAKLLNGKKLNAAIKTLATGAVVSYLDFDEQIKGIERSEILPEGIVKKLISSDDSEAPIFAWYDTETQKIKYYTKAKVVYMNEDSSYMYYNLKNLSSINLEEFKADYVRNMDWMFAYSCSSVDGLNLDFRNLNLSNVTSMSNMFSYFFNRGIKANNITINFSKMDLSNVKNVDKMFYYSFYNTQNVSGVTIDFSETDLSSVATMNQMFFEFCYGNSNEGYNIRGVTVNFSKADISGLINLNQMFYYAFAYQKNLTGVLIDFSEVDMRNLTTMYQMFYDFCYGYTNQGGSIISGVVVDFSKADVRNVQNMSSTFQYAFAYARSTTGIEINFREAIMSSVTNMYYMFNYFCYGYVNGEIGADISGVTIDFSKADMSSVDNMSAMFYYAFAYAKTITGLELNFSEADTRSVTNMSAMFYYFCYGYNYNYSIGADISGVTIDFSKTDLSSVTNMSSMFYYLFAYAKSITGVVFNFSDKDTSSFDVDGVTIDFSKVDMSNVTSMNQMFYYGFYEAKAISGLLINFSEADLSSVTTMYQMFNDFGYGNSSKVYNVSGVTIDFSKADMSSVENMSYMFYYAFAYQKNVKGVVIDFSEANMSSLVDIGYMFYDFCYGYNNLGGAEISGVTIDFSKADMSSLTSMYQMFYYAFSYATNITGIEINFSEADMSSLVNIGYMFYDFGYGYNYADGSVISGVTVDFSKADMSSVENMSYMFYYVFSYAKSVTGVEINFSEADISSVVTMYQMFYYFCYGNNITTNQIDIKWNNTKFTSSLSNMSYMFYYSYGITGLDLSSFDTSNVTTMDSMFSYAKNLKTIYVGSRFRTNNVTSSSSMFYNATSLVGGRGTTYNSSYTDKTYARVDKVGEPGYFTKKGGGTVATLLPGQEFNAKIKTMAKGSSATYSDTDTYIKRIKRGTRDQLLDLWLQGKTYEIVSTTYSEEPVNAWYDDATKTIYYYSIADEIDMNANAIFMFSNLTKLEEVELEGINTSSVSNMTSLFQNASSLTYLDLSSFDTSSVSNMSTMFNGCSNLTGLVLDNWNLSKIGTKGSSYPLNDKTLYNYSANMGSMFYGCTSLEKVSMKNWIIPEGFTHVLGSRTSSLSTNSIQEMDVSGWDLSKTKSLQGLFADSKVRRIVGLETWDTSKVENMNQLFHNCINLVNPDISHFDTRNVVDMANMFYNCSSLTGLDLSHFDTSNVREMGVMFQNCSKLETLNLNNWDVSKTYRNGSNHMGSMFGSTTSLEKISARGWKIPTIFQGIMGCRTTSLCSILDELDVTDWDLSNTTDIMGIFGNLTTKSLIGLDTWDTSHVQRMENSFGYFSGVDYLDLSTWNTNNVQEMDGMFYGANIKELDITKFDTRNVSQMNSMFKDTTKLKTIYVGDNFKTDSVTDSTDMFSGAVSIVGGNGTTYNESKIDKEYAVSDVEGTPGYFTNLLDKKYIITYNLEGGELTGERIIYTQRTASYVLPQPTKEGYTFEGWVGSNGNTPEINVSLEGMKGDLEFTAKWKVIVPDPIPTPSGNTGGGGGGTSSKDTKKVDDKTTEKEHESAEEKQETKQDEQETKQEKEQTKTPEKTNTTPNQSNTQQSSSNRTTKTVTVDPEIQSAYEWAYAHDVTTISTLYEANPDGVVTRGHLAKMVVNYATNVLGQEIPEKIPSECRWNDWRGDWESEEIKDYAVKSCALGLMGLDMDKFLPNMQVTRAQFGTIMSRLLWGKKYAGGTPYYRKHLNALKENGIMTQIENPERRVELRQWVWVMLMRSAQNK